MYILVTITLIGFMFVPLFLASMMPLRRAVAASLVGGYLFLPVFRVGLSGPVELSKLTVVPLGVLVALAVYQPLWFSKPKLNWIDLPMVVWCLSPIPAVLAMDQGIYEMVAFTLHRLITWGIPYWIGRALFSEPKHARTIVTAVFIGGLVYVPLCLFESRFSPQLHKYVYGQSQLQDYTQAMRMGGWRPSVFLQHGLAVGLWMVASSLCGIMLFHAKLIKHLPYAMGSAWAIGFILFGTVLTRSLGALVMLGMVGGSVYLMRKYRLVIPLVMITLLPSIYITLRVADIWHGEEIVQLIRNNVSSARAASLDTRLTAEMLLRERAMERPITGLGRFGDARVRDSHTKQDIAITDSYWIIAMGVTGIPSVYAFVMLVAIPSLLILRWVGQHNCAREDAALLLSLMGVSLLFSLDCLLNAMENIVFVVIIGSISGAALARFKWTAIAESSRVMKSNEAVPV